MDKNQYSNLEEVKGKGKKVEKAVQEKKEQYRVVITKEANACLEEATARINHGFEAGAVSRSDVAIHVFSNLSKLLSETDIKTIRALHFDEKRVLSSMLKQKDELPEEIRRALRDHCGVVEKEKRRTSRSANELPPERPVDNFKTA